MPRSIPPLVCAVLLFTCADPAGDHDPAPAGEPGSVAPSFLRNDGQLANPDVLYYYRGRGVEAGFTADGVLLKLSGTTIRLSFPDSRGSLPEGRGDLGYPSHFLKGPDPDAWTIDVPSFREVVYPDLYEGIDLIYRASPAGIKYDMHLRPGADISRVAFAYEGVQGISIDEDGDLHLRTTSGDLEDSAPLTFAQDTIYASAYRIREDGAIGFDVDGWDGATPLVIDPQLQATYMGGLINEYVCSVATDRAGFAYLAGWTVSGDFPTTPGTFQETYDGTQDAFIVKVHKNKSQIQYATYVGGGEKDIACQVALGSGGASYLVGNTASLDFPVTDGSTHAGGRYDVFVLMLDDTGTSVLFGTYLGGSGEDFGESIAVLKNDAYVAGSTRSADFPTTAGAHTPTFQGLQDGFVARVDTTTGSVAYSTYLGGSSVDFLWGIAVDDAGSAHVAGSTISRDFPVTPGSFSEVYRGGQDGTVTKLSPDGFHLEYSGFLGGTGFDRIHGIDLDDAGRAFVAGTTYSTDMPTTVGAYDGTFNGGGDGFVARVEAVGDRLGFLTYLGGAGLDEARAIAVRGSGRSYVTGFTTSPDFPVTADAYDPDPNGGDDAFVTELGADGTQLRHSTFLGGRGLDRGHGIAVAPKGVYFVSGETRSFDFPVDASAFDSTLDGVRDGFLARFSE